MKNISYVIQGVFAVAIIVLFVLFFATNKSNDNGGNGSLKFAEGDSTGVLPIAYVNVDSLLVNYVFAKQQNEILMNNYKSMNAKLGQKQQQFEAEVAEYQRKAQNNAFLSQERAEQEGVRLQKLEAELRGLADKYKQEYMNSELQITAQITDSVRTCLKEYNKKANYQVIFNNTGLNNILLAKESYDITKEVVVLLNSRYKPEVAK